VLAIYHVAQEGGAQAVTKKRRVRDISSANVILSNFLGRPPRWVLVALSMLTVLFPLYWLATSSFKLERDYLANPPVLLPTQFSLDSFRDVFTNSQLGSTFLSSLIIAAATTLICVAIGSMAAYALARGPIGRKAKNLFGLWFLVQKMYPAIATAIPIYMVMRALKLMDTRFALIIMNTSFNLPMVIWLMMGFFEQLPFSLEESGMLDGAGFYRRYWDIIMPITKPGLIAAAILTFVATWNEFLFAVILTIKKTKTLPVVIAGFITDRGLDWGPMAAASIVMLVPVVVMAFALQRDFVQGLAMGAVKG
jgi:multiple sugar transport system permease protein